MVDPDAHGRCLALGVAGGNDGLLDLDEANAKTGRQGLDVIQADGVVRRRQSVKELEEQDGRQGLDVPAEGSGLLVVFVVGRRDAGLRAEPLEEGRSALHEDEGVGAVLEQSVQLAEVFGDVVHDPLGADLAEEGLAGGVPSVEAQEGGHPGGLLLGNVVGEGGGDGGGAVLPVLGRGRFLLAGRDAKGGEEDGRCLEGLLLGGHAAVVLLAEGVELVPGEGVKEVVLADPEEGGELLVVRGHELGLGRGGGDAGHLPAAVGDLQDVVDVLDRAESLGVEAKGGGDLQLDEASLQVQLDGLGGPSLPAADLKVSERKHI